MHTRKIQLIKANKFIKKSKQQRSDHQKDVIHLQKATRKNTSVPCEISKSGSQCHHHHQQVSLTVYCWYATGLFPINIFVRLSLGWLLSFTLIECPSASIFL